MKRFRKRSVLLIGLLGYALLFFVSFLLKPERAFQKFKFPNEIKSGIWIRSNGTILRWNESEASLSRMNEFSVEGMASSIKQDWISSEIMIGEGYGAMMALELRYEASRVGTDDFHCRVVLIEPEGLPAFEWLGNPLLDRSLRSAQFSSLWLIQRLLPFSYLWEESTQQGLFESSWVASGKIPKVLKRQSEVSSIPVWIVPSEGANPKQAEYFLKIIWPSTQIARRDWNRAVFEGGVERLLSETIPILLADVAETALHMEPYLVRDQPFSGTALWVAMLMIALSTLVSEDLACIGSGILVAHGGIGVLSATIACVVGIYVGDIILYLIGRIFGERILSHRPFSRLIAKDAVAASEQWFERRGAWVLVACRFLPGTRVPVYFAAGMLKFSLWRVSIILGVAAILWVPLLVGLSAWIGERLLVVYDRYEQWAVWFLLTAVFLIFVVIHRVIPLLTHRGRRLAYSRWKRMTCWEFWPAKVIYLPVVFYILGLALRYRSLTLPTLSNPMLPCGGFIDESKLQILKQLQQAGAPVADFLELTEAQSSTEKLHAVKAAIQRWGGHFPVVLKPDQGERGRGVVIAKTEMDLTEAFNRSNERLIVQKYVPGKEFGVFYWRFPNQQMGEIPSVTRKECIFVTGDGTSTVEQLILNDERAICCAHTFLKTHVEELFRIPCKGEEVKLVEIGTHARGALFLDACELATPELREVLDGISHRMGGYYMGRFDLKVPDDASLQKGKGIQILELNLLTSEPTHMYDPKYSLLTAWKLLMRQWKIAFEIGDQIRSPGKQPMKISKFAKLVWNRYTG